MMRFGRLGLALAILMASTVALMGCGGGGQTPEPTILVSESTLDGSVTWRNQAEYIANLDSATQASMGMSYLALSPPVRISSRVLLSFDLNDVTATTIETATLRVYLLDVINTPFATLSSVMVDHVYYEAITSEENLYQSNLIAAVIGQISDGTEGSYKEVDVTAAVRADLNAVKDRSQFRLYYYPDSADWDLTTSHISTWATGDHATFPAQLVITYPAP